LAIIFGSQPEQLTLQHGFNFIEKASTQYRMKIETQYRMKIEWRLRRREDTVPFYLQAYETF